MDNIISFEDNLFLGYKTTIQNLLSQNKHLSENHKSMIGDSIINIIAIFVKENSGYGIDANINNFSEIIQNIKLEVIKEDIPDMINYNKEENKITMKCTNDEKVLLDYFKILIQIITQRYDNETKRVENGLIYRNFNGEEYGTELNNVITSRIATLVSGIEDPKMKELYYDDPTGITLKDIMISNLIDVLGFENLISNFVNANGSEIFLQISEMLGSMSAAKDFYNTIDHYDEDRIENRKKYNKYMSILNENKLNNTPTL